MRRGGVLLTLWLVVAGMAVAVGTWALSLVGGEISDQAVSPLSNAAIDDGLQADRAGGRTATDPQASNPGTTPGAVVVSMNTDGGKVGVNCQKGDLAYIAWWNPALGYRADDHMLRGPATIARVTFEADKSAKVPEVTATVRCANNVPSMTTAKDSDDHHGGTATNPGSTGGSGGTASPPPAATATDDHGSGGHGADDGATDDHNRRGGGSGGGGSSGGSGGSG